MPSNKAKGPGQSAFKPGKRVDPVQSKRIGLATRSQSRANTRTGSGKCRETSDNDRVISCIISRTRYQITFVYPETYDYGSASCNRKSSAGEIPRARHHDFHGKSSGG